MTALSKHKRNRIQRVFRKQLASAKNDRHKSHGIEAHRYECCDRAVAELCPYQRDAEAGQPHREPAYDSRNRKRHVRSRKLTARILRDLLINLRCSGTVQIALQGCGGVLGRGGQLDLWKRHDSLGSRTRAAAMPDFAKRI